MSKKVYSEIPTPLPQGLTITDLGRGRLSVSTVKRDVVIDICPLDLCEASALARHNQGRA